MPWRSTSCGGRRVGRLGGVGRGSSSDATRLQRPAPPAGPMRPRRGRSPACAPDSRPLAGRPGAPGRSGCGGPQRGQRVVGHLAGPHQVPQRGEQLVVGGTDHAGAQLAPEHRPAALEHGADRLVDRLVGPVDLLPTRREQRQLVGEAEPHAPVVRADRAGADPHHLARRAQLVEQRRAVVGDTSGEHVALERRRDDRRAGEHAEGLDERLGAAPGGAHALPRRQERGQRLLLDRLDLAAQRGQRPSAQLTQHVDVAPLAAHAVGPELAAHQALVGLEGAEGAEDPGLRDAEPGGHVALDERTVGAGVATDEVLERTQHRVGEHLRQAEGKGAAERVAVAGGVVGGGVARLLGDDDLDGPALGDQHVEQPTGGWSRSRSTPRSAARARRASGRRPAAARRAARRPCGPGGRPTGAAGRARHRPAPRGRAARAAPRHRAGRRAGHGRGRARPPAARRAGRRLRTCRRRSS